MNENDHRSATVESWREKYLPWVHKRTGAVRHVDVSNCADIIDTLCGQTWEGFDEREAFRWNGRTDKPAGKLRVCKNCATRARAIVEEADG